MKVNDVLFNKKIILKELTDITPKTRKKIKVYLGVDVKNIYYLIVESFTKSRFIMKNAKELIEFITPLSDINFKRNKKILLIESEICSKSKKFLKENGWRII